MFVLEWRGTGIVKNEILNVNHRKTRMVERVLTGTHKMRSSITVIENESGDVIAWTGPLAIKGVTKGFFSESVFWHDTFFTLTRTRGIGRHENMAGLAWQLQWESSDGLKEALDPFDELQVDGEVMRSGGSDYDAEEHHLTFTIRNLAKEPLILKAISPSDARAWICALQNVRDGVEPIAPPTADHRTATEFELPGAPRKPTFLSASVVTSLGHPSPNAKPQKRQSFFQVISMCVPCP